MRSHQPQYSLKPKHSLYQIFLIPRQLEEVKKLQKGAAKKHLKIAEAGLQN